MTENNYLENKQKLRKVISIVSIVSVVIAAAIGLGLLFKVLSYSEPVGNILLSVLTVFVAGFCMLNAVEAVARKNKVGIITVLLILISALLILIMIWAGKYFGDIYNTYSKVVIIIAMASLLFDLIIGNYVVMQKKKLFLQIINYLSFIYVEVVISFLVLGNPNLILHYIPFVACIIVFLTTFAILRIMVREKRDGASVGEGNVVVSKNEIDVLKAENESLKAENERLKKLLEENGIQY